MANQMTGRGKKGGERGREAGTRQGRDRIRMGRTRILGIRTQVGVGVYVAEIHRQFHAGFEVRGTRKNMWFRVVWFGVVWVGFVCCVERDKGT